MYRQSEPDQANYARIAAAHAQTNIRAKGKAGKEDRAPVLGREPVECGTHIVLLALAVIVLAFAQSGSAKVKAQHRQAEPLQGLGRVVNHFVVHGSAAERMRMADQRRKGRVSMACVEQGFESAGRAAQVFDRAQGGGVDLCVHKPTTTLTLSTDSASSRYAEDEMHIDPIQLTRQLIDIESTTFEEGAVGVFLAEYLTKRGFFVETMPVSQPEGSHSTAPRANVYAAAQSRPPVVTLSTHMDTVPPYFGSSEDEQFIYGRGACDAKGIIAAQIVAAERLREAGVPVALLFVVGEERDSAGARVANQQPRGSRFLINGEPTDNRVALASKGALRAVVKASGKMAHSAYPELGDSATHKLVHALDRILAIPLPENPEIGPSTLNIGTMHGGYAPNVIADQAEAQILVRLVGDSASTKAALEHAAGAEAEVSYPLEIPFQRMRTLEGLPTMIAAFTTDVPWLSAWGEPVLLGPGSIHVAHTPNERLAKQELLEAIELYVEVARRLSEEPVE